MTSPEWKSPRKIEEEIREYRRQRFENYMQREDEGELTRALALTALTQEIENTVELDRGTAAL